MSQLLQIENTICSKCGRIPRIHLNKDQPGSISLHCNCGNTQTTSITEYLFDVSACPLPPIFDNESEPNKVDVDAIFTAIAQGHDHIDNYLVEVKNNVISTLTEIRQNIEKAFNDCVNNNNDILNLVEIMLKSYMENMNEPSITNNLIMNTNLNIKKYENNSDENKNYTDIVEYFNKLSIFEPVTLSINKKTKFIAHNTQIYSLLILQDGRIASCSGDKTIKIFDPKNNFNTDIILEGHLNAVTHISQAKNAKILSCSFDYCIKIWNVSKTSGGCEYTIKNAHNDVIRKVIPISHERFASCSDDYTVKIWSFSTIPCNLLATLKHDYCVSSIVQFKGTEHLAAGSFSVMDPYTHIWDLQSYTEIEKIHFECRLYDNLIEISGNVLVGSANSVRGPLVNIEDGNFGNVTALMELNDNEVLVGLEGGNMCKVTIGSKKREMIVTGHKKAIVAIRKIDEFNFAVGSFDGTISIWNCSKN